MMGQQQPQPQQNPGFPQNFNPIQTGPIQTGPYQTGPIQTGPIEVERGPDGKLKIKGQ